jgi:putative transposase
MTPLAAWEQGIAGDDMTPGRGEPMAVADPRRFLIDFLPLELRLIRREGVWLTSIGYWSDVLRTWFGHAEKMIVRYDPRDLSRIYLLAPDGVYYDLTSRDLGRPAIGLWEHRLALKRLREEGRSHVDEAAIFRTIEAMRQIADEAVRATKTARRQKERRLRPVETSSSDAASIPAPDIAVAAPLDGVQPHQRMFPVEEW